MAYGRIIAFLRDESAAVAVEVTATVLLLFVMIGGIVDGSMLFYQWNAATKAVQHGARMAAVSDPVANQLNAVTGLEGGGVPGQAMPSAAFDFTCTSTTADGGSGACTCAGPSCPGTPTYNATSMRTILFGRCVTGSTGCPRTACGASGGPNIGMCNYFPRLDARKVSVRYQFTGLGYAGRPGGPVPTVTVSVRDLTFDYVFLQSLLGKAPVNLPGFATTVTGEDLRKSGS